MRYKTKSPPVSDEKGGRFYLGGHGRSEEQEMESGAMITYQKCWGSCYAKNTVVVDFRERIWYYSVVLSKISRRPKELHSGRIRRGPRLRIPINRQLQTYIVSKRLKGLCHDKKRRKTGHYVLYDDCGNGHGESLQGMRCRGTAHSCSGQYFCRLRPCLVRTK